MCAEKTCRDLYGPSWTDYSSCFSIWSFFTLTRYGGANWCKLCNSNIISDVFRSVTWVLLSPSKSSTFHFISLLYLKRVDAQTVPREKWFFFCFNAERKAIFFVCSIDAETKNPIIQYIIVSSNVMPCFRLCDWGSHFDDVVRKL